MTYFLAPGVSYAKLPAATVVLDLRSDRYLRLGGEAAATLDALAAGQPVDIADVGLSALRRAGLLAQAGHRIAPVVLPLPVSSATETARTDLRKLPTRHVLQAFWTTRWHLSRDSLAAVVAGLRRARSARHHAVDDARALAIAQDYARLRRWLPGSRSCVPEAFTLSAILSREGIAHDVVFGVSLTPFAAHAWTQTSSHVLTDRADPLKAFHPVFLL